MLRQRDVTASENMVLGDMTSTMEFIICAHGLVDTSHIWKGKAWFSLLSMQNIIQNGPWWLFFSYPMVPSNPSEKNRRRTNYNFSAAVTVTVKLGILLGRMKLNRIYKQLLLSSQFCPLQKGHFLILNSCCLLSLFTYKWFYQVFWELDFKCVQIRNFQNKAFYKNLSSGRPTSLAW